MVGYANLQNAVNSTRYIQAIIAAVTIILTELSLCERHYSLLNPYDYSVEWVLSFPSYR